MMDYRFAEAFTEEYEEFMKLREENFHRGRGLKSPFLFTFIVSLH